MAGSMCSGVSHQPAHDFHRASLQSEAHSTQPAILLYLFIVVRPTLPSEGALFLCLLSSLFPYISPDIAKCPLEDHMSLDKNLWYKITKLSKARHLLLWVPVALFMLNCDCLAIQGKDQSPSSSATHYKLLQRNCVFSIHCISPATLWICAKGDHLNLESGKRRRELGKDKW